MCIWLKWCGPLPRCHKTSLLRLATGEPLVLEYHIRNKCTSDLKGKLVAFYEWDLDRFAPYDDYYMAEKDPQNQWNDEIGTKNFDQGRR